MERYLLISSDGHAGPRPEVYREYLDPQYRDEFDVQHKARMEALQLAAGRLEMAEESAKWAEGKEYGLAGAWDSDRRNEILDGDGVAAEILFVDGLTEQNSPPFGGDLGLVPMGANPELQWAGARAHNRWIAEFVAQSPERRYGLAQITPFWGVDTAIEEIRWTTEHGVRGILMPHLFTGQDPYHHPKYDPLWRECEERDVVIHFHSGAAPAHEYFGAALFGPQAADPNAEPPPELPGALGIYVTEVAWWLSRPVVFMIWGGVYERFPKLKTAITEGASIWVPELLELMDHRYGEHHGTAKLGTGYKSHLSMKPSEYFRRNVRVGSSVMSRREAEMRYEIGIDTLMWGTDYPHPEGSWPLTRNLMLDTFRGLPRDDIAKIIGGNAAEFYGFDTEKLAPIVDRIGPPVESFDA